MEKFNADSPAYQMKSFKEAQIWWSKVGRDNLVKYVTEASERKDKRVPSQALKNGTIDRALGYAFITNEQTGIVNINIKQLQDANFVPALSGVVVSGHDAAGGFHMLEADGYWEAFNICYYGEIEELAPNVSKFLYELQDINSRQNQSSLPRVQVRARLDGLYHHFVADKNLEVKLIQ
jgi:hypothetical protein